MQRTTRLLTKLNPSFITRTRHYSSSKKDKMSNTNTNENASLIGGHAQFVKGAAENVIGSVTGSAAWSSSGESDKNAGIESMKAASANRDSTQGYGKVEEVAGKLTGCEGMEEEGKASKKE